MVNEATVTIAEATVGTGFPAYLIAELGINHGGNLDTAKRLVAEAAGAGADAVKLQTYRTEWRVAPDSPIFEVLKQCELDASGHEALAGVARDQGVHFMSTPFDAEAVELLSALDAPAYKVASFDIVNLELVEQIASVGRPVILSRGMATLKESDRAVQVVREAGTASILLHCVSAYPLEPGDANLAVMDTLSERYDCPVGFSDHTTAADVPALAVARGATVIEKHFTLDREADGPDHALSADPELFAKLHRRIREVEAILGSSKPRLVEAERGTVPYRRPTDCHPGG